MGRKPVTPRAPAADDPFAWQRQLAHSLDELAAELPTQLAGSEQALHSDVVLLLIQLAHAAVLEGRGESGDLAVIYDHLRAGAVERAWADVERLRLHLSCDWLEAPAVADLEVGKHAFSASTLLHLIDWLRELARHANRSLDGAVQQLGALHEALLGARFEQLSTPARRLRGGRGWLRPALVLGWAPEVRAKRLQRDLGLSKRSVEVFSEALARAATVPDVERAMTELLDPRAAVRPAGAWVVQPSSQRRRSGAHYTPWPLCVELVERTLSPIVQALPEPQSRSLLEIRICDPAMGAGAFLVAATQYLATALVKAWQKEGFCTGSRDAQGLLEEARHVLARSAILGVDRDPMAVSVARLTLSLFAFPTGQSAACLRQSLRAGDALVGNGGAPASPLGDHQHVLAVGHPQRVFHWPATFPNVFGRDNPGFDAVVGNPPWIAYVGRAAQPLEPMLAAYYAATNPAFKRYRTLHGLFVYRSATLLRRGGRLGLILPTSVADLDGYRATRTSHDELCVVDAQLPDWGDGVFAGVFQPSMALLSTRRQVTTSLAGATTWPLSHDDLCATERQLLERLRRLPRLPSELFGERGFQTTRDDQAYLRRSSQPSAPFRVALREGADLGEFRARPPQLFADPDPLMGRLRPPAEWGKVALLIRQTARFPIAAPNDGSAFRNSILAGFASPAWPAPLLLCLLNSGLVRWLHFTMHRDARQGMPQLKVGHLRSLPALPSDVPRARAALAQLGSKLAARNAGITAPERAELELLVAEAFALSAVEREAIARWCLAHPPPASRRQALDPMLSRPVGLPAQGL
jgi:hypothetical protein